METAVKKKSKHPSKSSVTAPPASNTVQHFKGRSSRGTFSQFWKVYSFFKSNVIVTSLLVVLLGAFVLKYYEDVHDSYSNFKKMDVNIYNVLEVSKDAKEPEIKAKYRELSLKWHPDKNKDCPECEERFMKIKEAYKIILNPSLREMYDRTKGHTVDMIPSKTTNLTLANFDKLVKGSSKVWVVQVYSDDSHRSRAFAPLWDEFATKFEKYAKFGRVNALLDEKLLAKLPSKPLLHPSIFLLFPDKYHDLVPMTVMDSMKNLSRYFYENYPFYGTRLDEYAKFRALEGTRLLFYSPRKNVPLSVKFMALKFHKAARVYYVSSGEHYSKDELLLEDMKRAESMPRVPEKLELYDLFVGLYEGKRLRYFSYQLGNKLPVLHNTLYSLFSLSVFDLNENTFDALCSRHSSKDRVCMFLPAKTKLPDLASVYAKYERYDLVLAQELEDEPEVLEEGEKEQSREKPRQVSAVDLQLLRVDEQRKQLLQLYAHHFGQPEGALREDAAYANLLLVNRGRNQYALVPAKQLGEELVDDVLNDAADLKWLELPASCRGDAFKANCLNKKASKYFNRLFHN